MSESHVPLHVRLGPRTAKMLEELVAVLEEGKTPLIHRLIRDEHDRQSHRFVVRGLQGFAEQGIAVDPSKVLTSTGPLTIPASDVTVHEGRFDIDAAVRD